jgi:hypothetical protein
VIPLTAANLAAIAKTGTLEVASAGWKVTAWVVVGLFAAAYIALIVLTAVRRPRAQRPEVGEDTLRMLRRARAGDHAGAEADAMAAEYRRQQGDKR